MYTYVLCSFNVKSILITKSIIDQLSIEGIDISVLSQIYLHIWQVSYKIFTLKDKMDLCFDKSCSPCH